MQYERKTHTIWRPTRNQMKMLPMILHYSSVAIGTGIMQLGTSFQCGIILAIIVNLFFAITSFLSYALMSCAASSTKCPTNGEIFTKSISSKFLFPFLLLNISTMFVIIVFYMQFIQSTLKDIITTYQSNGLGFVSHPYIIAIIIFVIFIFPMLFVQKFSLLRPFIIIRWLCILFTGVIVIYYFAESLVKNGFDPNHQIKFFDAGPAFKTCILNFATSYLIQPVAAPSLDILVGGTKQSLIKLFMLMVLVVFVVYTAFGVFEYLTLFDENTGALITTYYPKMWPRQIANILLCLMMVVSIVLVINPIRYTVLKALSLDNTQFNTVTWLFMGIILFFAGTVLTTGSETVTNVLSYIINVTAPINLYIVPSILYLASCLKEKSIFWIFSAFFNILIGIAIIIFTFV